MGCASSSSQCEVQQPDAEKQHPTETQQASQPKQAGSCLLHTQQGEEPRKQRSTQNEFDFPPDPNPNRISLEGQPDGWSVKNKPVPMMDCAGCDLFGLDIALPDGSEVRLEGLSQTDFILDTKREVVKKAQLPLEKLDEFILEYYGCWMGDEFMLNAFGIPWNGTQLSLRSKADMQREAAVALGART